MNNTELHSSKYPTKLRYTVRLDAVAILGRSYG